VKLFTTSACAPSAYIPGKGASNLNVTASGSTHLEGCLMVYTTPKVVYTTLGIYHGIYKRGKWYTSWYIPQIYTITIMVYTINIYHGIYDGIYHGIYDGIYLAMYHGIYTGIYHPSFNGMYYDIYHGINHGIHHDLTDTYHLTLQ
jgi:hypothetical protein